jgi:hypothetical protein
MVSSLGSVGVFSIGSPRRLFNCVSQSSKLLIKVDQWLRNTKSSLFRYQATEYRMRKTNLPLHQAAAI